MPRIVEWEQLENSFLRARQTVLNGSGGGGSGRVVVGEWGGWPGGSGPGGMRASRVGGGWYKRSYSPKGCLYGGV